MTDRFPDPLLDHFMRRGIREAERNAYYLRRLEALANPQTKADEEPKAETPFIDLEGEAVLQALSPVKGMTIVQIGDRLVETKSHCRPSSKTIGQRVNTLIEQDLAQRPHGNNAGAIRTPKGDALLESLGIKTTAK